jgi:hypothetical protein
MHDPAQEPYIAILLNAMEPLGKRDPVEAQNALDLPAVADQLEGRHAEATAENRSSWKQQLTFRGLITGTNSTCDN